MIKRILFMLCLLFLSAFGVFRALILPAAQVFPFLLPLHIAIYGLGLIALVFYIFLRLNGGARWISRFFVLFFGMHSFLFAALLVLGIAVLVFSAPIQQSAFVLVLAAYVLGLFNFFVARLGPKLEKVELGQGEKPFSILQISDLHIGATVGAGYVKKMVDRTLAAKPDCIVLTGDIGDGDPKNYAAAAAELGRLKAPHGVFLVLGNHELYWPTDAWIEIFRKAGMQVLIDDVFALPELLLVGLAPYKKKSIAELVAGNPLPFVVLSHYPDRAEEAAAAGARLFLAGHTHGGQFWPWSWFIYFFHRYAKGLYQVGKTSVYVSRGTGYWGPPFRLGARAEITLIGL